MANKLKVTKRLFNSVKKLAKTDVNKAYIMKVSGLSNMTVYRILKAKTYEEYRGEVTRFSRKNNERAKDARKGSTLALKLIHEKLDQIQDGQRFIYAELGRLSDKIDGIETHTETPQPEKHWWSR